MVHALFNRYSVAGMVGAGMALAVQRRRLDRVPGEDSFSKHTREQIRQHPISGMHSPFVLTAQQRGFVESNFPQAVHLLPGSLEDIQKQQTLGTAVKIESLSKCPFPFNSRETDQVLVVGGPFTLVSAVYEKHVVFLNSENLSILPGPAYHLEWDAQTQAPTNYLSSQFIAAQLLRLMKYESLSSAAETGQFSWRSLDWVCWLKHPEQWGAGLRIALAFQRIARADLDPDHREATLREVAFRTKANKRFYKSLNWLLHGQLLSSARGSILVARTDEERDELLALKKGLEKEGHALRILSKEEVLRRYGFVPPNGIAFGEKTDDRFLCRHFMRRLADYVEWTGGQVIQGTLAKIYVDDPKEGGIALYRSDGGDKYIPFSKLIASLTNQGILDRDGHPLFDSVSARGVSALALAYVPKGMTLPDRTICGGKNNVIKLADPVELRAENGEVFDVYLLRMTAGVCITPHVSEKSSADYDGTAAVGLIAATRQTLGCDLEVLTVYGSNKQVTAYGESHWLALQPLNPSSQPSPWTPRGHELDMGPSRFPHPERGVYIEMGAGGEGLAQAPAQARYFEE